MIRKLKDRSLSTGALYLLNRKFARYGRIEALRIDTEKRTIGVTVHLKGEVEPIEIHIEKYVILSPKKHPHLRIERLSASRAWITIAAEEFLLDKTFPVPERFLPLLTLFI